MYITLDQLIDVLSLICDIITALSAVMIAFVNYISSQNKKK